MDDNQNKKVIKTLSLGHFITDAYSGFLNPIMPFIAAKIGITMAVATVLISISNLTSSLSQPFFGFVADNWQRRFFIFWGMLMASVFLSFLGIAPNIWILALFIILGHMGVSFFHPQATSIISNYSKQSENGFSGQYLCCLFAFYVNSCLFLSFHSKTYSLSARKLSFYLRAR